MLIQNYIQLVLSYLRYLSMFVSVLIIDLRVKTCDVINTAIPSVRTECWLRKKVINVFIFDTLKCFWVFLMLCPSSLRCKPETKLFVNFICTSIGIRKENQQLAEYQTR